MRHHAGQFGFVVRSENQAAIDVEEPPGRAKALISSDSTTLIVKGTFASEFRTRFWPTRLTYSLIVGSSTSFTCVDLGGKRRNHGNLFVEGEEVDIALIDIAGSDVIHIGILRLFAFALVVLIFIFVFRLSLLFASLSHSSRTKLPAPNRHGLRIWPGAGTVCAIRRANTNISPIRATICFMWFLTQTKT